LDGAAETFFKPFGQTRMSYLFKTPNYKLYLPSLVQYLTVLSGNSWINNVDCRVSLSNAPSVRRRLDL